MERRRSVNWEYGWLFLFPWLVASPGELVAQGVAEGLSFLSPPRMEQNPNPAVPLAAVLSFESLDAVATRVDFDDGERTWSIDFDRVPDERELLPILGMRPARRHEIRVTIFDSAGGSQQWDGELEYTTPPLPVDRYFMPDYDVRVAQPERMEPGVTILSVRRSLLLRP